MATEAEVLGRKVDFLTPRMLRAKQWQAFTKAVAAGQMRQPNKTFRVVGVHKDGHTVAFRSIASSTSRKTGASRASRRSLCAGPDAAGDRDQLSRPTPMPRSVQTFLFADLVGFTALTEHEGDDRALEVALELQRRAAGLLAQHGVEHVKSIGDGLMLRSANPRDAIRLALQLVHQLADQTNFPALRIGIHTGPALSNEGDWYGATVNVAARLCAIAPGGEIIVSEAARSAAGRMTDVKWSAPHTHRLRNVTEPIAAHTVTTGSRYSARAPLRRRSTRPISARRAATATYPASQLA